MWIRSRPLESALREEDTALREEQAELREDGEGIERALALAYRYLSRRERTVAETRAHLLGKGIGALTAESAIQSLVKQGYLDDARFSRLFAEDKRMLEQWGNDRIRLVLRQRGVDRDHVDAVLSALGGLDRDEEGVPADTELGRALGVLRKRFPVPPRDRRERDRALGVLMRKGYGQEVALEALASHARDAP